MRRNSTLGRKGLPSPSAGRTLASLGCGAGSAARRFDMADPKANAELARELYDRWNARDFDALASLMANDGEIVLVGSDTRFRGPNGALEFSRMWADAFPDGRVTVERTVASDDYVSVEFTGKGTHTG